MTKEVLYQRFALLHDPKFREFQIRLIPNIDPNTIVGVRTPGLRKIAREIGTDSDFLHDLPHRLFEENQIHIFMLNIEKDFGKLMEEVERFLPYIDNWATCDQFTPLLFKRHHPELLPYVRKWIGSDHPYTVRFAIKTLMDHYLGTDFDPGFPAMVCNAQADDYYVRMMVAWYFATALAKQYDAVLPYITEYRLPRWTHNKAIQKAVESYRITAEQKAFLKQYRLK